MMRTVNGGEPNAHANNGENTNGCLALLADNGINIQMISTSEIKISMIVDAKYAELAVRILHEVYHLDK